MDINLEFNNLENYKCGDIFMSKTKSFLLNCKFCKNESTSLDLFSYHLNKEHSFVFSSVFSTKNTINNKDNQGTLDELLDFPKETQQNIDSSDYNSEHSNVSIETQINEDFNSKKIKNTDKDCNHKTKITVTTKIKVQKARRTNIWQCDVCDHICTSGKQRKLHEKTHESPKTIICETCGKGLNTRNSFKRHMRIHTGKKPFKCRFCSKSFTSHNQIKAHNKTHIDARQFKCDFCEYRSNTKNYKKVHEQRCHLSKLNSTQNDDKEFICKLCGKEFKCNDYLLMHMKRHANNLETAMKKPYHCAYCPNTYATKSAKSGHERLNHKGEYNYTCDFCGKPFLKLAHKRYHEQTHTRVENTYACNLCEKVYARCATLVKHKKLHHRTEVPYKCDICKTGFTSALLYKEHCKQHNIEDNPFDCEICKIRFKTKTALQFHLLRMHYIDTNNKPNQEDK